MNDSLKAIIFLLSDGKFHSGLDLAETLQISEIKVQSLIEELAEWDLEIESLPQQCYRLKGGLSLLDKEKIYSCLEKNAAEKLPLLEVFDCISSTNDYLLELDRVHSKSNWAILAERQTQGRGRQGRVWISPFARNIHLSLLWHFSKNANELSCLSLAIAISVLESLQDLTFTKNLETPQKLGIKWPNDIIYDQQKLGGILIEFSPQSLQTRSCSAVVIGIGVNASMPPNISGINQVWTDIQKITQQTVDRSVLAGTLLDGIIKGIILFEEQGFLPFVEKWYEYDLTFGKKVSVITHDKTILGVGRGINDQGHFLLETENGTIERFMSGDVSIRLANETKLPGPLALL